MYHKYQKVHTKEEDLRPNFLMCWTLNHFNSRTFFTADARKHFFNSVEHRILLSLARMA